MALDEAAAAAAQAGLDPAWERAGTASIRRTFSFPNFVDAFGFATRIALLAQGENHHPDLEVGWGRVSVTFSTHSAGGLTDNDFAMAAKVDALR
ncbi:MAG TPA: 4a-hydroxytetrahydrobiopterin dehydratase [Actinomycetota bacterium]|nr:4a-hydroxytetrahydrobiopterin dehydratase [Actinomycetota bacterium]